MLSESPNEYSLPGVLHYLQAEWRQFERERNEWAIERAELKARVNLLEGERRGLEGLRFDLMKRIKMLEYSLREERKRHMKAAVPEVSAMSAKLLLDDDIELSLAPAPYTYNAEDAKKAKAAYDMLRERSREALKSCLQEINHLIATPTKFPMTRTLSPILHMAAAQRHTKVPRTSSAKTAMKLSMDSLPASPEDNPPLPIKEVKVPENVDEVAMMSSADKKKDEELSATKEESPEDLALRFQKEYNMDEKPMKKTMKRAGRSIKSSSSYDTGDHQSGSLKTASWKPHMKIKGHMDSVRSVAFHPTEEIAATGSDDYTVKVWSLTRKERGRGSKDSAGEAESSITYRGHTQTVTGVVISAEQNIVFSCSLDATIGVWRLPPEGHGPSSSVDPTLNITKYVGHTDAVWDISLHNQFLASASADGSVKLWNTTARSEETLKYTLYMDGQRQDTGPCATAPTSLDFVRTDPSKVVVSYTDAKVGIFDVEKGEFVSQLTDSTYTYDNTVATQINTIISHPTDSLIITGHEDHRIKLFDERSGRDIFTLDGHLDGVTSLDVDHSGRYLVSGGHDGSIRAWDLRNSNLCIWEVPAHQKKADEGVLSACCHRSLPFMMSGGADGIVKVYRST